jgi:hypothetical protein
LGFVLGLGYGLDLDTVFTSGLKLGLRWGIDFSLRYGLGSNKVLFWVWDKDFKWDTPLVFDLVFGLYLNLIFILGLGLRTST